MEGTAQCLIAFCYLLRTQLTFARYMMMIVGVLQKIMLYLTAQRS